ncbi:hypothetical protein ACXPVS_08730 [Pseudomonas sp. Ma2-10]
MIDLPSVNRAVDEGSAAELAACEDIQNWYLGAEGQGTLER